MYGYIWVCKCLSETVYVIMDMIIQLNESYSPEWENKWYKK